MSTPKISPDYACCNFCDKTGNRINTRNIYRLCQRVLRQVSALLNENEQFKFTPHKLRHTFLKKVTDKHGVHFTQELSGNVSIKEIFRNAKLSQDVIQATIAHLISISLPTNSNQFM